MYFYQQDGKDVGPLSREALIEHLENGNVTHDTPVRSESDGNWQPCHVVVTQGEGTNQQYCSVCANTYSLDELADFDGAVVCVNCKAAYVQALREGTVVPQNGAGAWVDRKSVIMRIGGSLPNRCVKCNGPAHGKPLKRDSYYCPWWIYLFLLLNILIVIIAYLITRKKVPLMIPLCDYHRKRRFYYLLASWAAGLGSIPLLILAVAQEWPWLIVSSIILFLAAIIVGSMMSPVLRPRKVKDGYAWLSGTGAAYRDSLPKWPG